MTKPYNAIATSRAYRIPTSRKLCQKGPRSCECHGMHCFDCPTDFGFFCLYVKECRLKVYAVFLCKLFTLNNFQMIEVSTGARSSFSVAAANKLTSEQLKALSPAIAKFCCRAARLGNVYQLSSSGIVVPGTTAAPTPQPPASTTTKQATTTTTQAPTTTPQPTTTTAAPPPPPNHPGVGPGKPAYSYL